MSSPVALPNEKAIELGQSVYKALNQAINISPATVGQVPVPYIGIIRESIIENYKSARFVFGTGGTVSNSRNNVYSCPSGKCFLLCGFSYNFCNTAGTLCSGYAQLGSIAVNFVNMKFGANGIPISQVVPISPVYILNAADSIWYQTTSTSETMNLTFWGYEINSTDLVTPSYSNLNSN